ncbi:hypothetical protein GJ744_004573 [Endocarpon pusillum]|uniref:Uncharacterized protein n=1 Tax=Endocarpon pusillum TaxID=364733 RepID=A0A8H7APY6_9EURO|nr:hypothetical protein GJ744_004573 [Endocarpon pusillum]
MSESTKSTREQLGQHIQEVTQHWEIEYGGAEQAEPWEEVRRLLDPIYQLCSLQTPLPTIPEVFRTPSTRAELQKHIQTLVAQENPSHSTRFLLRKTAKAFDQLHVEKARDSVELNAQKRQIERLENKRGKKVAVDPNESFVNIENIKRVKDEQKRNEEAYLRKDRAKEAAATSAALLAKDMESFMGQFNSLDRQ